MSQKNPAIFSRATLLLSALIICTPVLAQPELQSGLANCAVMQDVIQRLSCYDRLAKPYLPARDQQVQRPAAPANPAPQSAPQTPAVVGSLPQTPAVKAPEQEKVENFGKLNQADVRKNESGQEELVDTVVSVRNVEPTKLQVTLSSGQVWRQSVGKRFRIREGETVRISQPDWGGTSFRLTVDGRKGFIQVARVE